MNIQEITNKVEAVLDQAEEALYIHTIVEQAMVSKDDATNALKRLAAQGLVDCTPTQGRWGNRYALIRSAKPVTTEAQRQEQAVSRLEEVLAEGGLKLPTTPEGLAEALRDAHDGLPEGVKQALNEVDLDEPASAVPPPASTEQGSTPVRADESAVDEAHDRDNHICAARTAEHQVRINELAEIATAALYNHGEAAQAMLDIITHPDGEHVFNGLIEDSRRAYMRAVYFHVCDVNEALHKIGGAE